MTKICLIQMDDRISLDYLLLTQSVNKKICKIFNYDYIFIDTSKIYINLDPKLRKITVINDFINNYKNYDILIFLDSDAWVNNGYSLNTIVNHLINDNTKLGCYSRDPILVFNTYINSGAFILKINDESRQMYKDIIVFVNNNPKFITHIHPFYDQPSISHYVFNNKDKFIIFNVEIFNTPIGSVIRHNWHKNKLMFDDLNKLLEILDNDNYESYNTEFDIQKNLDTNDFPNKRNLESYAYLK